MTFGGTVIRVAGRGVLVQEHTKTIAGMRTIQPPSWVMDLLKRRSATRDRAAEKRGLSMGRSGP
ncbi:hypothetical protein FHX46_001608 [Amycolatopsis viridis]|uniref:Uncharacterized protein n=1 Tax=Amycolatopsis viridis TaxID=185678 RepID=A0ABX0SRB4_9PSEU|nr:hypothetical protein [Amycolatopsis viridis]